MDIIIVVQDHATEKNQIVLSALGQKIIDTFQLAHLIPNAKSSATHHRLYIVPPHDGEKLYNLIAETNPVQFKDDAQLEKKVKRMVLVHVGKQLQQETKTEEEEDQKPGLQLRQQFLFDDAQMDKRDIVRKRIAAAYAALKEDDQKDTKFVASEDVHGSFSQEVIEALQLHSWTFRLEDQDQVDQWKRKQKKEKGEDENDIALHYEPRFALLSNDSNSAKVVSDALIQSESQNFAKDLAELPANLLTPTIFANKIVTKFSELKSDKVKVTVQDEAWARSMDMNSFLAVAQGSDEPPKFVEVEYRGRSDGHDDVIDLFLVGKGVCFDSGGISLKPGAGMKDMKSDMGGAASVLSALHGIARQGIALNVNVVVVLVENMPSGKAIKPGDVVRARNKKSIEIDNTDAEGRLILADALVYASEKSPKVLVDVATLTGAVIIALGNHMTGAYTSTRNLWNLVEEAGVRSNDYFWRMPLYIEPYKAQLKSRVADLNNIGGRPAGSATAATFLSEFVDFDKVQEWAHLDIAGTSTLADSTPTGRPTRSLIELAKLLEARQK